MNEVLLSHSHAHVCDCFCTIVVGALWQTAWTHKAWTAYCVAFYRVCWPWHRPALPAGLMGEGRFPPEWGVRETVTGFSRILKHWKSPKCPRTGEESGNLKAPMWPTVTMSSVIMCQKDMSTLGKCFESKEGYVCILWLQLWLAHSKHWINAECMLKSVMETLPAREL